jgi:hypothetical protein
LEDGGQEPRHAVEELRMYHKETERDNEAYRRDPDAWNRAWAAKYVQQLNNRPLNGITPMVAVRQAVVSLTRVPGAV